MLSVHNEIGTYQKWYAALGECESSPFFQHRRERWEFPTRRLVNMNRNSNIWRRVVEHLTHIINTWGNVVGARNGTNRRNEIYRPRVNQPRETANSRGEKSVTGSSVGLQFHKWWGPARNHFWFMIIFITMILIAPIRVHASNPWFKYDKIQQYCRYGPWVCYIIYYETRYAKNEEDFLPMSILEIWETLVAPSRFVSVTKCWKRLDYILWHLQSRKSDNDD